MPLGGFPSKSAQQRAHVSVSVACTYHSQQFNHFILSLRSNEPITGLEDQVRWPQESPSDQFSILAMHTVSGSRDQDGRIPRPQPQTKSRLRKAPEATWPLSPCWLQGTGLYRPPQTLLSFSRLLAGLGRGPALVLKTHRRIQVTDSASPWPPAIQQHKHV